MPSNEPDDEGYEDELVSRFGLDGPLAWADNLQRQLSQAAAALTSAVGAFEDTSKEITATSEARELQVIRTSALNYLAILHQTLSSMPILQQDPTTLKPLRDVIAGIANIDRGSTPAWLQGEPTKRHKKRLEKEAEWVPVIAALELMLTEGTKPNVHQAAKAIADSTKRKVGTIKYRYRELFLAPTDSHKPGQQAILQLVQDVRERLAAICGAAMVLSDRQIATEQKAYRERLLADEIQSLLVRR